MTINNAINFQYNGYKNFIINGSMSVWQRNTTFTAMGAAAYTADMWYANVGTAAAYTVSRQSLGSSGIQYLLRYQRISGQTNTSLNTLAYAFTTVDSIPLQGQQVTLSFYARSGSNFSPTSSNIQVYVATGTGTDQSMASLVAGTWTGYSNNTGTTIALTTTLTRYSYTVTLGSTITQAGVLITFTPTGTASTNDYLEISGVQLELGYIPTAFEIRPFSYEIRQCQSWYQKSFLYATVPAQNIGIGVSEETFAAGNTGTNTANSPTINYCVLMRAAPTVTFYNCANTNAQARNNSRSADCTNTTISDNTERMFTYTYKGPAGTLKGEVIAVNWQADASL